MQLIPYKINKRRIFYMDIKDGLQELYTAEPGNWAVLVIEDDISNPVLIPFAELCIDKSVIYMMASGKAFSEVDDLFDQLMVLRRLDGRQLPYWYTSEEDVLMTAWDDNLEEAFWFIVSAAYYEEYSIETVVVANLTSRNYLNEIEELARKISIGWLPLD
jgi:hypothetical protein